VTVQAVHKNWGKIMAKVCKRRGRYVLDFYDHRGQRHWKTLPKGTTKKQAKGELNNIEKQVARHSYVPERRIPTFKKLAEDWIKVKANKVRASTLEGYKGHLRHHFDDIKDVPVNRITPVIVEHYLADKVYQGMNLSTLRRVTVTFNQIMKYAVRHNYTDYNPVRDAERPRAQGEIEKKTIRILNATDIRVFIEATGGEKYKTLFMLAIMSGARQGELLGLMWTDIDWFNSQVRIERTYNKKAWYRPKTRTSKRRIDIGPTMLAQLRKWQAQCPKNKLNLIFPKRGRQPYVSG
jgi:integrase